MRVNQHRLDNSFTEMSISFENPVTFDVALAEIEERNFFGYHPAGYGFFYLQPKFEKLGDREEYESTGVFRDWKWNRYNSCD